MIGLCLICFVAGMAVGAFISLIAVTYELRKIIDDKQE